MAATPKPTKQISYYSHSQEPRSQSIVVDPTKVFYVSCMDGGRFALLAGPYDEHEDALAVLPFAQQRAEERDLWAHFYAFGTCGVPRDLPAPRAVFGRMPPPERTGK